MYVLFKLRLSKLCEPPLDHILYFFCQRFLIRYNCAALFWLLINPWFCPPSLRYHKPIIHKNTGTYTYKVRANAIHQTLLINSVYWNKMNEKYSFVSNHFKQNATIKQITSVHFIAIIFFNDDVDFSLSGALPFKFNLWCHSQTSSTLFMKQITYKNMITFEKKKMICRIIQDGELCFSPNFLWTRFFRIHFWFGDVVNSYILNIYCWIGEFYELCFVFTAMIFYYSTATVPWIQSWRFTIHHKIWKL